MKPDSEFIGLSYPIDLVLFNEETHSCITLASKFLGLDTNGDVTESLLSLFFVLSTCRVEFKLLDRSFQSCFLKSVEFLAEKIHSELVNFHSTRFFRFQSFLLKMFLSHNEENLHFPELVLIDEMTQSYCKFINGLMEVIYNIFFQKTLPRVLPKMKDTLHLSPSKMIGYWFLSKSGTIIILYSFVHQPYILPAFLTTRIFSLEFIRKKVKVEEEHILNFRKSLDMKFQR